MRIPSQDRRFGIIRISGVMIEENIKEVSYVFSKIKAVIFRVEEKYDTDEFEYFLYSPLFDLSPVGQMAPIYKIDLTMKCFKNGRKQISNVGVHKVDY